MNCPICGEKTRVLDTVSDCEGVYRRRRCLGCDHRFYTTESDSDGLRFREIEQSKIEKRGLKHEESRI